MSTAAGVVIPPGTTVSLTRQFTIIDAEELTVLTEVTSGAGSVQVTVNGVSPDGYVWPLLVGLAGSLLSPVAPSPLRVGPGLTPSPNAVANDEVPRTIQVVATVTGTVAYGIDYEAGALSMSNTGTQDETQPTPIESLTPNTGTQDVPEATTAIHLYPSPALFPHPTLYPH